MSPMRLIILAGALVAAVLAAFLAPDWVKNLSGGGEPVSVGHKREEAIAQMNKPQGFGWHFGGGKFGSEAKANDIWQGVGAGAEPLLLITAGENGRKYSGIGRGGG